MLLSNYISALFSIKFDLAEINGRLWTIKIVFVNDSKASAKWTNRKKKKQNGKYIDRETCEQLIYTDRKTDEWLREEKKTKQKKSGKERKIDDEERSGSGSGSRESCIRYTQIQTQNHKQIPYVFQSELC